MKLHAQASSNQNTVTAYGPDFIEVNRVRHHGPLWMSAEGPVTPWNVDAAAGVRALQAAQIEALVATAPELLIIGTGARHAFLAPELAAWVNRAGVGCETMDTAAACRTYNILTAEGRRVVGAFLPAGAPLEQGADG